MISKWKTYAKTATTCLAFTWVANEIHKKISSTPIQKRFTYSSGQTSPIIPLKLARSLDAILVLGGGRPTSLASPPSFVKSRCDAAAKTALSVSPPPAILALSAGTAHVAQLMEGGLPVWESTASVGYIGEHYPFPPDRLFAETSSYDTISNAFFARTSFTDVNGWRRLLIVTNEVGSIFGLPRISRFESFTWTGRRRYSSGSLGMGTSSIFWPAVTMVFRRRPSLREGSMRRVERRT